VLGLVVVYAIAEVVGGWLTGSLALLADAAHMASDAAALGLALFALWFARRPSVGRHTYGFHRSEILAALANGAALVAVSLLVLIEAWERFREPVEVSGGGMTLIATGGLVINLVSLWLLHDRRHESLNMSGAWLHVLSDTLGSAQAIIAGILIQVFGWHWADPVASVLISLLVIASAWGLLKESVSVLMESAPEHLDVDALREAVLRIEGVEGVHDLHVWTITSGLHALSAHVHHGPGIEPSELLSRIRALLQAEFGLDHLTIQLEPEGFEESGSC
jgi:cobalt-zinc-cadmium efflux system protein